MEEAGQRGSAAEVIEPAGRLLWKSGMVRAYGQPVSQRGGAEKQDLEHT